MSGDEKLLSDEHERLKALHGYHILDTPQEHQFDNLCKLAALICNTSRSLIVLIDKERLWIKSSYGIKSTRKEMPRNFTFGDRVIRGMDIFEIPDTLLDDEFAHHPIVTGSPFIRFYAGAPLQDEKGFNLGAICVYDESPKHLTPEQREGLGTLAKEVITHLSLRKRDLELQDHAKRFEDLLAISAISPEIHCILDFKGNIVFINGAVTQLLGYPVEEALKLSIWDVCFPDDAERVVHKIEEGLRAKKKEFYLDFRVVSKTGATCWISWSMVVKNGRWYAYGRDITENKRVENELMKLSFVASKVNNAIVINDSNNHVTWVNEAFEKITGFTLEDLKGKRLGDLITGPKTDLELIERARELNKKNQSFTVDLLAYRKDKKPIWLSIYNTVVLDDHGKVNSEVEIIIDITEKKRAEEELQVLSLVASKTNTGVNISDKDSYTTWINESLSDLIGYTLDEVRGKRLGDIVSTDPSALELILQSRKKAQNKQSYTIEVEAVRKDGTPLWLSVSNTPVINSIGEVERQIDLISDITQRKQVEKEMLEAKEKAMQLSEAKEMFLSVMSHEIRTPLNAIIGMTHLLMDNHPKESQISDLNILKFSGDNLLNIINDILDFTKMETGNLKLESIPFSLSALVNDIANSLQVSVNKRGNKLDLIYDTRIPKQLLGDKTRLYQILMNLLGNAIKFTERGLIELMIRIEQEDNTQITLSFAVKDNGIGIPADKQSYIFESFTQAKTDISRKYGGTGLGLAITKKLLKLYDSDISVESTEGMGTVFSFCITFSKLLAEVRAEQAESVPEVFRNKRILVVDDNDVNVFIAKRILGKWGFEIDIASDGFQAIDKAKNQVFDLVLMDIKMPGMDGFEATRRIREMEGAYFKNLPIMALTASALSDEIEAFEKSGMNGHIQKPFNPVEIKLLLQKIFSSAPFI